VFAFGTCARMAYNHSSIPVAFFLAVGKLGCVIRVRGQEAWLLLAEGCVAGKHTVFEDASVRSALYT
jgi:hypothetical protein